MEDTPETLPEAPKEAPAKFGDLFVRILSAVVMAAIGGIVFWKGGEYVAVLLVVVGGLMSWEFRRLILPDAATGDMGLWVMVAGTAGAVIAANLFGFVFAFPMVILAAAILWQIKHKRPVWMATAMLYLATPLAALLVVRDTQGLGPVLWLVGVVIASDVGGYFAGRMLGGPKFWPAVSPKKTWSGTIGGWVLALGVGFVYWIFNSEIALLTALFYSVVLALAAQGGDLFESWLKRRAGVKDASNLIPGHGGFLDRFDGMLAATSVYMILHLSGAF